MSTIFSIGEIATIFDVSTQALRLYDRIDLLKPCYVNEKTGYRYYSIGQFVNLECIKRYRAMGVPLEKIKELIDNDSSSDAMLEMVKKQKSSLRKKIEELELMEEQLMVFEKKIEESSAVTFNKIEQIANPERVFVKYKEGLFKPEELEIISREVVLKIQENYAILEHDLSFSISFDEMRNHNEVRYKFLAMQINHEEALTEKNLVTMAAGTYLTMYFEDSSLDNRVYYNQMIRFIEENQLEVVGDFIETAIVLRVNKGGQERTLAKLEILCKS